MGVSVFVLVCLVVVVVCACVCVCVCVCVGCGGTRDYFPILTGFELGHKTHLRYGAGGDIAARLYMQCMCLGRVGRVSLCVCVCW